MDDDDLLALATLVQAMTTTPNLSAHTPLQLVRMVMSIDDITPLIDDQLTRLELKKLRISALEFLELKLTESDKEPF